MKRLLIVWPFAFALAAAWLAPAWAIERPRVECLRVTEPIRVDGALDEPAWSRAAPIGDFRLILQREGEIPSEATELRVLVDDDHVYFGLSCANRNPGAVRASLTPRDQITDGDFVAIHLDTYRDLRRAYVFGVNPYGVQLDGILDGSEPDFSWDAVWNAETRRGADGWTAEVAIPLHAIRFPRNGDGVWGLWVRREITKNDEVCSWPLWRQAEQGDIMLQAADLSGMAGLRRSGGLDLEPYVSSLVEVQDSYHHLGGVPPVVDANDPDDVTFNTGIDLRYPVTSTLVANATVNPDFSQVEADALQIDVNQRFALFYPEKRPFFLEGAEFFTTPLDLVYTRRIADPTFGGKVTGKVGRASLGVIALGDDGGGSLEGIGAGESEAASRQGDFQVARLAYDAGDNSRFGFLATRHVGVNAATAGDAVLPGGVNTVVAGDTRLRLAQPLFLIGQVAWSETRVREIAGAAPSPPQAIDDLAYSAHLRYADGIRELELYQDFLGPDFRAETGFIPRVDARTSGFNSNFFVRPENAWIRSWQPILNGYTVHDHAGALQEWWVSPMIDWSFQKQTTMHTMYVRSRQAWQGVDYDLNRYVYSLGNSLWRPLAVTFDLDVGDGIFYGDETTPSFRGWSEFYNLAATARPTPRFTAELSAARSRFAVTRGGDEVFDVWALGAKTTLQFTRRLYARVYPQYRTDDRHVDLDALLGYVVHPGSVVYLGVSGDYETRAPAPHPMRHTVVFKVSHRFGV